MVAEFNKYISTADIAGNILAHFFDGEGRILDEELNKYFYIATYDLNKLKDLKASVCISGGEEKVDALIMFAKKRFFNKLITDENTAKQIIERMK